MAVFRRRLGRMMERDDGAPSEVPSGGSSGVDWMLKELEDWADGVDASTFLQWCVPGQEGCPA